VAAGENFQRLLALSTDLEERSAAYLWIGKSRQAMGEEEAAKSAWEQAAVLDPTGYYSERAKDYLLEQDPFTPPMEYDLSIDVETEQREAEDWIRTIFGIPEETDLAGPGQLENDARFQRGNEFWRLGLYEMARIEFEELRKEAATDPATSYRLANHLLDLGLYRTAIFAARQVLTQAGMDDAETMSAPIYFNHLRFGPYYRELIMPASEVYNFHPLILFSVVRQESLFEGFVRSSAGARGLMQIIPNTGQEIAANADWPPDYSDDDLYRPLVSINLGSNYLNRQRGFMSGDLYGSLAAYNAGPGNAAAWKELVPPDPDLMLEVIRFSETREYIKGIYEIFSIYKKIYDRSP
jgi:soluble lytic murein transglycosylase